MEPVKRSTIYIVTHRILSIGPRGGVGVVRCSVFRVSGTVVAAGRGRGEGGKGRLPGGRGVVRAQAGRRTAGPGVGGARGARAATARTSATTTPRATTSTGTIGVARLSAGGSIVTLWEIQAVYLEITS